MYEKDEQNTPWHSISIEEIVENFGTDIKGGLDSDRIAELEKEYGKNILRKKAGPSLGIKILKQFKSPLIYILIFAGILSLLFSDYLDASVIAIVLLINVIVGVVQEERASKAFAILNRSQQHLATIVRDGKKVVLSSSEVVPGDIVIIEAGMNVPADLRILDSKNLKVNESILTGEWINVEKNKEILPEETPLVKRRNMTWMGTTVTSGYGSGIVVAISARSQLGSISGSLSEIEESDTPIQKNIRQLSKFLFYLITFAVLLIVVLGVLRGSPLKEIILLAIATAVAVIPESLPASVTVVLAIGMERILKKGGLVKNLLAAETLGSTTVILTDKTGTLTQAKMKVSGIYTLGAIEDGDKEIHEKDKDRLLKMAVSASDAFLEKDEEEEGEEAKFKIIGRPIESAILAAGLERGIVQEDLEKRGPRIDFLQFSSDRGYAASLNKTDETSKTLLYISGEPEVLLEHSKSFYSNGNAKPLEEKERKKFAEFQKKKSLEGERFIAVAYREAPWKEIPVPKNKEIEDNKKILNGDLIYVGLLSFSDPVRENVPDAVAKVREAGARVMMMTGDNPGTAVAVARKIGLTGAYSDVLTGSDIEKMEDDELISNLKRVSIYARVLPNQKLRISRLLKSQGEIVAMTGDGINDAPALKSADIGIAIGSGTDVAKESSDLVLIENSFSVIVDAIEEGRRIMDNLKKIITYLLAAGFGEIFVIGAALVMGTILPILPTQVLWINIVEGGLMNFAYAFEPAEKNIMKRNPRDQKGSKILSGDLKKLIILVSVANGIVLIALYYWLLKLDISPEKLRTMIFFAISIDSLFYAFSIKGLSTPIWRINFFSNKYLIGGILISISLLIASITFPPLKAMLSLVSLEAIDMYILIGIAMINLFIIEATKFFLFER